MVVIQKVEDFVKSYYDQFSKQLVYHNYQHILDVRKSAEIIGKKEGLTDHELLLVDTAALFHDIGFFKTYDNHEDESIMIVSNHLNEFGYSDQDVKLISQMIDSTKLPQNPQNHLDEILCDADLDNLGRDDFMEIFEQLYIEKKSFYRFSKNEWYESTLAFIKTHRYFTQSAFDLRNAGLKKNIERLENDFEKFKKQNISN